MNNKTPFYENTSAENEINEYFDSLPKNVQETIIQSYGNVNSLDELKSIANNLTAK